jgi:hypothetical protein
MWKWQKLIRGKGTRADKLSNRCKRKDPHRRMNCRISCKCTSALPFPISHLSPLISPNHPNPPTLLHLIPKLTHHHSKTIGTTPPNAPPQTPEEKAAELHAYDQKLYKAQCAMNESMSQVLKHLGVPFFGTHAALILPESDGNGDLLGKQGKDGGGEKVMDTQGERPKWSPRVTGRELLELKRRMVAYLEDMYKG